jgi:hypothetical protein
LAAIDAMLKDVEPAFSHLADYLVLRLLHLVAQPLKAAEPVYPAAPATVAGDEALEIRSGFDFTLTYPPGTTMRIDPVALRHWKPMSSRRNWRPCSC